MTVGFEIRDPDTKKSHLAQKPLNLFVLETHLITTEKKIASFNKKEEKKIAQRIIQITTTFVDIIHLQRFDERHSNRFFFPPEKITKNDNN